ncbi:MAG: DUF4340 domain-containing protein [Candidatus Omnitrophica bacterium]|nr:DUF4340 domain-containing protein [Candidatus Omnitrophota bacterium]
MHWKTTVVLLVATVGIGAYVSLYELRQPDPERREELATQIVDLSPDEVMQAVFDLPQAKGTITREGTVWRISPKGLRASRDELAKVLDRLAPLTSERTLSASNPKRPLDLKTYGLDPGIGRLSLTVHGVTTVLRFGETTAVGGRRYLQVEGSPRVHVVDGALFDEANQPVDRFRDPHLIPFDVWMTDEVSVKTPGTSLTLARRENAWWLTQPVADRAERSEANGLLNALSGLQVKRVLEETVTPEGLPAWGLDQPATEITVTPKDQAAPVTAAFGTPLPDDASLIYATRSDESVLYAVAAAEVGALARDPHGLRAKACFDFFTSSVAKVQLEREGRGWTITKADGRWTVEGSPDVLDPKRVEEFLSRLADLRLGGFVEDRPVDLATYGLIPPAGTLSVWLDGQDAPQRLLIGSVVEGTLNRYGRIEGREAVVRLPEAVSELLNINPEQFQLVAGEDEAAGAEDALDDGGVAEDGQRKQRPPEEVAAQRAPGQPVAGNQAGEVQDPPLRPLHQVRPLRVRNGDLQGGPGLGVADDQRPGQGRHGEEPVAGHGCPRHHDNRLKVAVADGIQVGPELGHPPAHPGHRPVQAVQRPNHQDQDAKRHHRPLLDEPEADQRRQHRDGQRNRGGHDPHPGQPDGQRPDHVIDERFVAGNQHGRSWL